MASKGRIGLGMPVHEWVESALRRAEFRQLGLEPATVIESCALPGAFRADPADRLLVATGRLKNRVIVTRDNRILKFGKQGRVRTMAA